MKRLDVLLFVIDKIDSDRWTGIPLGLAYLAGQLRSREISYKILDFYNFGVNRKTLSILRNYIKLYKPRVIGISSTAYYINNIKKGIDKIRKIANSQKFSIPIIIGGYISLLTDALQVTGADIICHGEGEKTFLELMNHFLKTPNVLPLSKIRGISYKQDGSFYTTPSREVIADLDQLDFPDFKEFDFNYYKLEGRLPIYTQRGCYNNCSFCDIAEFYGINYVRRMSPARVIELIEQLKKEYDFDKLDIMDDNFLNSSKHVKKLFSLIQEHFWKNGAKKRIRLEFQARADDVLRMRDILLQHKPLISMMEIGIESFSQEQLNRWNKKIKVSQNVECIEFLCEHEFPFVSNFLWIDKHTTLDELKENVRIFSDLPDASVFKTMSDGKIKSIKIPLIMHNVQISAIYDKTGNSTVKSVPFLDAAEFFLDKTGEIVNKMSELYVNLSFNMQDVEINENDEFIAEYFPRALFLMKKRYESMLALSEKVQALNYKRKTRSKSLIKKELKNYISAVRLLIKPYQKLLKKREKRVLN